MPSDGDAAPLPLTHQATDIAVEIVAHIALRHRNHGLHPPCRRILTHKVTVVGQPAQCIVAETVAILRQAGVIGIEMPPVPLRDITRITRNAPLPEGRSGFCYFSSISNNGLFCSVSHP